MDASAAFALNNLSFAARNYADTVALLADRASQEADRMRNSRRPQGIPAQLIAEASANHAKYDTLLDTTLSLLHHLGYSADERSSLIKEAATGTAYFTSN